MIKIGAVKYKIAKPAIKTIIPISLMLENAKILFKSLLKPSIEILTPRISRKAKINPTIAEAIPNPIKRYATINS